jgi:hypothetical protein
MGHGRAPGVQNGGDADPGPQMLRIGGDRQHGLGRDFEQQIVKDGLALVGDVGDRPWFRGDVARCLFLARNGPFGPD